MSSADTFVFIGAVATIVSFLLVFLGFVRVIRSRMKKETQKMKMTEEIFNIAAAADYTRDIGFSLDEIKAIIAGMEKAQERTTEINKLDSRIGSIEEDLTGLKNLLFDDPEKVVTIPLIKKDIDFLKEDLNNLRSEFDRMSGLAKWLISIMITMSVGLLGLAISILLK